MARRAITMALALAAAAAVAGFLFAWSGLYSVAASAGHFPWTAWLLHFGMRNSVETHAAGIEAPALADPALAERGAGHFARGCAPCHGAPGAPPNPVLQAMLPPPPDLAGASGKWTPAQLFWIVKNGIKYAGMPAWPAQERADEVWAMVAFLQGLPGLSPEGYRDLSSRDPALRTAVPTAEIPAAGACDSCHGPDGGGGAAGGVPAIAGQKAGYLEATLRDYRQGARPSGIMGPVAAYLGEDQIRALAARYASLDGPTGGDGDADDPRLLKLGAALAASGDSGAPVAACAACHGADGRARDKDPAYPALAGQRAAYLELQLRLFRAGSRGGGRGEIMAAAVRGITDEQIRAVSDHYAGLGGR